VVIDAVRCCKLGLDNRLAGPLLEPSSYFKKSPPVQYTDDEARRLTEEFITRYGWKQTAKPKGKPKVAAKRTKTARPAAAKTRSAASSSKKRVVKRKK
jgi:myo-inositol-1-phosphate synthase